MGFTFKEMDVYTSDPPNELLDDNPGEDVGYIGENQDKSLRICLRRVYMSNEHGEDVFFYKMKRIVGNYRPEYVLCHISLFKRVSPGGNFPAVKALIPYIRNGIKVGFYTGANDDRETTIAEAEEVIDYFYNVRDIEKQMQYLKKFIGLSEKG